MERNEKQGFPSRVVTLEATTMRAILDEHGVPRYMKIDIEGFDHLCIEGLRGLDQVPNFVSMESSATSQDDTFGQLALMHEIGYSRFKLVPQHDINKQVCPTPPRGRGIAFEGAALNGMACD